MSIAPIETAAPRAAAPARAAAPVQVIRLRGTQAEMGAQHGRIVRGLGGFEDLLAYYPRMPGIVLRGVGGGGLGARLLGAAASPFFEAGLRRLERARPADLRERSRAFLEALGAPAANARHFFVMDLLQNVVGLLGRHGLGPFARRAAGEMPPACSSIAVWGRASADGALRYARNFDFPGIGIWDRAPAVVLCAPDRGLRYGFVTTRGADVPGVTAFNEAGLAIAAHTRFHREVSFDGAGIVDLGHEIARRAETLDDALRIARERRVASSYGIAVSSARERRGITLETTAASVEVVGPEAGEDFIVTTNRYRHPVPRAGEVTPSPGYIASSNGRYRALHEAARAATGRGGLGGDDLEALLGTHEDPEAGGAERAAGGVPAQAYTVQSVVIEPAAARVRVSTGRCPAGKGPYATVPWDWDASGALAEVEPDRDAIERAGRPSGGGGAVPSRYATGAAAEAYALWIEASRLANMGSRLAPIVAAVERAVTLDPGEPTYRLIAGGFRLQALDGPGALEHFEAGLRSERAEFRRGQLLLCAARAADLAGDPRRASACRLELLATTGALLAEHRAAARAEEVRPLPRRALRALAVSLALVDVQ